VGAEIFADRETIAAFPVLVEHVAVAHVGDARATNLSQPRKRSAVSTHPEERVDPISTALPRRAVVRRADADQRSQLCTPRMVRDFGVVTCTARYEAAHAVAEQHDLVDRNRPCAREPLEQCIELAAVRGDVQTGVVENVDRRAAEVRFEPGAVIVLVTQPLAIGHRGSVHEHQELARRIGNDEVVEVDRAAVVDESHLDREWVLRLRQVVAEHAVERTEDGVAISAACSSPAKATRCASVHNGPGHRAGRLHGSAG